MNQHKKPARIIDILTAISVGIILVGSIFRICHWPFAVEVKLINMFSLGSLVLFTGIKHYRKRKQNYSDSIGLLIILLIISIQFNKLVGFTKMEGLVYPLFLLSAIWILIVLITMIRKKTLIDFNKGDTMIIVGLSCLIVEVILRYNHLPTGTVFYIAGLLILVIGSGLNYKRNKEDTHNIN